MLHIANCVRLVSLASIRTGLTLRNEYKLMDAGNVAVLQPRNLENGELQNPPLYIQATENSVRRHLLIEGDILIANKGQKFATFLYKNEFHACVASSSFFVVRADPKLLIPGFLAWYLEQDKTKDYLLRNSASTTIHSLSKTVLAGLEIPGLGLADQKIIVTLINLVRTEQLLLKQLIKKNDEFLDSLVWEKLDTLK